MTNEWGRVQELLVAVNARLRAFTDRDVRYYLEEDFACVKVSALMFLPKTDQGALMTFVVSRLDLPNTHWNADRAATAFVHAWIDKIKMEQPYAALTVVFGPPPAWAKVAVDATT